MYSESQCLKKVVFYWAPAGWGEDQLLWLAEVLGGQTKDMRQTEDNRVCTTVCSAGRDLGEVVLWRSVGAAPSTQVLHVALPSSTDWCRSRGRADVSLTSRVRLHRASQRCLYKCLTDYARVDEHQMLWQSNWPEVHQFSRQSPGVKTLACMRAYKFWIGLQLTFFNLLG